MAGFVQHAAPSVIQKPAVGRSTPGERPGTASLPMIEGFLGLSASGSYDIALTAVMAAIFSLTTIATYVPALRRP